VPSWGPTSAWIAARFFPQYSGEKGVGYSCGGGELRVRGAGRLRVSPATACPMPWHGWLRRRLQRCLLLLGWGVAARSPYGRRSHRVQVGHTYGFSRTADRTGGSYMVSYVAGAATVFLDVLTPLAKTGARTFKRAEAAIAHRCRGGCRHRASNSLALMASLPPPVGRWGRGPFRSGVHAEMIAAAGESLVQRRPSPSMLMWSPLLASHSRLAIPWPLPVWR
jgi:hypothetical protein